VATKKKAVKKTVKKAVAKKAVAKKLVAKTGAKQTPIESLASKIASIDRRLKAVEEKLKGPPGTPGTIGPIL
jgi:hypothetical protein